MRPRDFAGLGWPPIDQVGFVVRDLDQAVACYAPAFGAFKQVDAELREVDYRGRRVDCRLRIATANSGPVEIELIELVEGEAIYREFLEQGREGPHHLRFPVDDLDAAVEAAGKAGLRPVFGKRFSPTVAFSYLEAPDGMLFELLEIRAG
jgi:catechol 2,3-dioxygenase-like lactoylglutathione lyase family enzyme